MTRRTVSQVLAERQNAVAGGCCDAFADGHGCRCLEEAIPDGGERPATLRADLHLPDCPVDREQVAFLLRVITSFSWPADLPSEDINRLVSTTYLDDIDTIAQYIRHLESILALLLQDETGAAYAAGYDAGRAKGLEEGRKAAFDEGYRCGYDEAAGMSNVPDW